MGSKKLGTKKEETAQQHDHSGASVVYYDHLVEEGRRGVVRCAGDCGWSWLVADDEQVGGTKGPKKAGQQYDMGQPTNSIFST